MGEGAPMRSAQRTRQPAAAPAPPPFDDEDDDLPF
jgi:hypothetical protein